MSEQNLRDYGMGESGEPTAAPTWEKAEVLDGVEPICPNCGGWLCAVKVAVDHPMLKGGKGFTNYLGCPACPYASPAVAVAGGAS